MIEDVAPELGGLDRWSEVSALLDADDTNMGEAWRRLKAGETPQQIEEEWGVTLGPVYSFINLQTRSWTERFPQAPLSREEWLDASAPG